ncbi:unnamed protein product (macronuclear) [Paramecium tetraurelia]|uniref:HIT-type domain-containing protein n=1 Tax=Paramecium tetraurelia TaxID=5888 RepID=A0D673_PARTE|nr:uncharacterized protein GSPATT00013970001 [Paramecium tetraurelia]CAK78540.1 unnamed protein product [Paramecium tetraurelia]|eukprot:XP_001445937.1 hypothetical protein (macronuclear) [Paramecium tetraurelia strain d4-2]
MCDNYDSSEFSSRSSGQNYKKQDHQIQQNSESESENDQIKKKTKLIDDNEPIKISRKVSDDLIKMFERLPNDQITKLLDVIKVKNSPDLPVQVNLGDLMSQEDDFILDSQSDSQKEKMRKKRESKEKQCRCCSQFVKRHHCTHTECEKPCQVQEKFKKTKV